MFIFLIVGAVVVLLTSIFLIVVISKNGGDQHSLLSELGLVQKWTGESTSPFYKWGWKKASGDRVWGERIVKKAFRDAGIWLSPDDIAFFKRRCEENASGKNVDDKAVIERINIIVHREETISNQIANQVKQIVGGLSSLNENDAAAQLKELGVDNDGASALAKLTQTQFKRFVRHAGLQMFSTLSKGLKIEGKSDADSFLLRGFDSWCYWLGQLKAEIKLQLEKNRALRGTPVGKTLELWVLRKMISGKEDDIKNSLSYRSNIEQQIQDVELKLKPEDVEECENNLYTLQFSDQSPFSEGDHRRFRQFMTTKDLASSFRESLLLKLKSPNTSIRAILKMYPRNVIFYGDNYEARTFASRMYQAHLKALMNVFDLGPGEAVDGPEIVAITLDDIYKARKAVQEKIAELQTLPITKRKDFDIDREYMQRIIDKHCQYIAFERQTDKAMLDAQGWIIDIPLGKEMLPDEYRELKSGSLAGFVMYECGPEIDVDLQSGSTMAKKQRAEFIASVMEGVRLSGSGGGAALSPMGESEPSDPSESNAEAESNDKSYDDNESFDESGERELAGAGA